MLSKCFEEGLSSNLPNYLRRWSGKHCDHIEHKCKPKVEGRDLGRIHTKSGEDRALSIYLNEACLFWQVSAAAASRKKRGWMQQKSWDRFNFWRNAARRHVPLSNHVKGGLPVTDRKRRRRNIKDLFAMEQQLLASVRGRNDSSRQWWPLLSCTIPPAGITRIPRDVESPGVVLSFKLAFQVGNISCCCSNTVVASR